MKQDKKAAKAHITLLYGDRNAEVTFQVFDDKGENPKLARTMRGTLNDLWPALVKANGKGCGVFVCVNAADDSGKRSRKHMDSTRAHFLDLDNNPLPDEWAIEPSMVLESSPGKHQAIWPLKPSNNFNRWSDGQARLAAFYGGDSTVTDPPRVMRLAGFYHHKKKPFLVRIVSQDDIAEPCTMKAIAKAHPCDYTPPRERRDEGRSEEPEGGWDNPADVARARDWLQDADAAIEGENGDHKTFSTAAMLRDFGISEEMAHELMAELWNDRCEPSWSDEELRTKIANAYRYAANRAGADSIANVFPDEASEAESEPEKPKGILERMNRDHAVVNLGGKPVILSWGDSSIHPGVKIPEFMTREGFLLYYGNKFKKVPDGDGESKKVPAALMWLTSSNRPTFSGVTFDTSTDSRFVNGKLNLWTGFSVKPKPGDWSRMQTHILNIMAAGNEEHADYITKWTAWALQNPGERAEVALVFSGDKGTGKGFFANSVCQLFSAHGVHLSSQKHVTGNFNQHLMQAALVYVDEALWPGRKEDEGPLKRLITEPTLLIEPKNVNPFEVKNVLKIIMTSNEKWIVPASGRERRYAVFQVSSAKMQNRKYFAKLANEIQNGGLAAMLHDLLNMDLAGWHPRNDIPQTDELAHQKLLSAPPIETWFSDILNEGEIPDAHEKHGDRVRASDLYEHARHKFPALRHASNQVVAKFLKEQGVERHRSHGASWWIFPPLPEARANWRKTHPDFPAFEEESDGAEWHSPAETLRFEREESETL